MHLRLLVLLILLFLFCGVFFLHLSGFVLLTKHFNLVTKSLLKIKFHDHFTQTDAEDPEVKEVEQVIQLSYI